MTDAQKEKRFLKWLEKATVSQYQTMQSRLATDAWGILDFAMSDECEGTFGVGDYASFNSTSKRIVSEPKFDRWLKDLVKLGLIGKSIDDNEVTDDGFKRDVFTVTAKGSLVHYARLLRNETLTLASTSWLKRVHLK